MNADAYWQRLVAKNPGLADRETVMRITVASLEAQVRRAFEAGKAEGGGDTTEWFLNNVFRGRKP